MNKVILAGRLGQDPEIRYSSNEKQTCFASFSLGVSRTYKNADGGYGTDWIRCKAIGKTAEFIEKYLKKASAIVLEGNIQTGNYTNKEGQKVYTTDVFVEKIEFGQGSANRNGQGGVSQEPQPSPGNGDDGFMDIPDGIDEELPFN